MENETSKPAEAATTSSSKPPALPDAPQSVQTVASLLFLYGLFILLNFSVWAFRTGKWGSILGGLWQLSLAFGLGYEVLLRKKWAWWVGVLGGVALALRFAVGLIAFVFRWQNQIPQEPQFVVTYVFGLLFVVPVVFCLLRRDARVAFGLAKPKPGETTIAASSGEQTPNSNA